jgi:hypothetical protein
MLPSPEDARHLDSPAHIGWNPAQRIGFRLPFSYSALYLILVRLTEDDLNLVSTFGFAPGGRLVNTAYAKTWAPLVSWVGKHVLRVSGPLAYSPGGNSDGIFGYTQLFCIAALAVVATLAWTLLDRRRTEYRQLNAWLRVGVRYAFAFSMLSYGMIKIFDVQFSSYGIARLLWPYGDLTPFALLHLFMESSRPYTIFAGAAELSAGVLLFFRRTTTIGAMFGLGVMSNVVMLNFCYHWPEKLDSTHLLLMSVFLLAPDLGRLANCLVLNRVALPARFEQFSDSKWVRIGRPVAKAMVIIYMAAMSIMISLNLETKLTHPKAPFYGIYEVEEFIRNGQTVPPLATDRTRWKTAVFEDTRKVLIKLMDDNYDYHPAQFDSSSSKITIHTGEKDNVENILTYSLPDVDHLVLQGQSGNDELWVRLKKLDESKIPLVSDKFKWINGTP